MTEELSVDVLVAGGGVAGLMAAVRAQLAGARVALILGSPGASSSISGMNTALECGPGDDAASLFDDVMRGGGFINNPLVVAAVCSRIGAETHFLEDLGVAFVREDGSMARRRAAGSTSGRTVYSLGMLGVEISKMIGRRLAAAGEQVRVLPGGRLLQILLEDGRVAGGLAHVKSAGWVRISAPSVVLATGGAGRLFGYTTNPPGSRGVGYALGLEAGASLVDMEFIAFEPFVMAAPASMRGRSLPTTVLTEGARLRNGRGDEFLDTQSAPSKDVICRAMVAEVRAGRGTPSGAVYYDIREVAPEIVARYVQIPRILRALKMASSRTLLEVMPAPHYSVGGVRIDEHASTEVPGLYAAGEVAGGAHGAHRLAACSATEVVAMGAIAGEASAAYALANPLRRAARNVDSQLEQLSLSIDPGDREQLARMQAALASGCGVLRDHQGLSETVAALDAVHDELITYRTAQSRVARANLVALAIAHCALARHESRGDHFRVDYARRNDVDFLGNFAVRHSALDDHLQVSWERAGLARRADAPLDGAVPRASP